MTSSAPLNVALRLGLEVAPSALKVLRCVCGGTTMVLDVCAGAPPPIGVCGGTTMVLDVGGRVEGGDGVMTSKTTRAKERGRVEGGDGVVTSKTTRAKERGRVEGGDGVGRCVCGGGGARGRGAILFRPCFSLNITSLLAPSVSLSSVAVRPLALRRVSEPLPNPLPSRSLIRVAF